MPLSYNEFMIAVSKEKSISVEEKWYIDIGYLFEGTLKDIRICTGSTISTYLQSLGERRENWDFFS